MQIKETNLANTLDGETLAYLGDAIIELYIREKFILKGCSNVGTLNDRARDCVRAKGQSDAFRRIEDELCSSELAAYKRGRNTSRLCAPKSASMAQYRCATGFEALFGYLHICGEQKRIKYLLDAAYSEKI